MGLGAAATGRVRSPTVDNRVPRTISDDDDAERRRPRASRSEDRRNSSARYDDAVPCKHFNVRTASFLLDAAWKVKPAGGGDCLASPVTTSLQSLPRAI